MRMPLQPMSFKISSLRSQTRSGTAAPTQPPSWCRQTPLIFTCWPLSRNPRVCIEANLAYAKRRVVLINHFIACVQGVPHPVEIGFIQRPQVRLRNPHELRGLMFLARGHRVADFAGCHHHDPLHPEFLSAACRCVPAAPALRRRVRTDTMAVVSETAGVVT